MNRKRILAVAALCVVTMLIISACAKSRALIPVRAYLYTDEAEPLGFGAYGYLVFAAQPGEKDMPRYQHVCDAFQRGLVEAHGNSPETRASQMATFWPLKLPLSTGEKDLSCEMLVKNYDYWRVSGIATAVKKQGVSGPVLVAWTQPFQETNSSDALVLDMSDFADEDLDRAFAIWRERITTNPSAWQNGFKIVLFREAFRSLLQKYGETVLGVIHPAKSAPKA
jgi:hypothetical protein